MYCYSLLTSLDILIFCFAFLRDEALHFCKNFTVHYFVESNTTTLSSLLLQIDFGSLRKVTRIATMGAFRVTSLFVTTFKLEYSRNGLTWEKYRENGQVKVSTVLQADAFSGLVGRRRNTTPLKASQWETKPVCVRGQCRSVFECSHQFTVLSIFRTTTA